MRRYRGDIDGLRAIAVIPVILFHAGVTLFKGGFVGVDIFFVISGYLISSIIIEEKDQGRYSIIGFYERRVRRILPALFVVLIACMPFAWMTMMPAQLKLFGGGLASVVTYISNIWFWKTTNYFAPAAEENPLLHTWSLSVEEQFYVFFPLFLALTWPLGRRAVFWVFTVFFVGSLAVAQWSSIYAPTPSFYILPTRAWELLVGALVALIHARPEAMAGVKPALRNLLGLSGMALLLTSIFFYGGDLPYPSLYTLAPVIGTALLLYSEDNKSGVVGRVLCWKPFVACGLISYSLYLWHQPIFSFARLASIDEPSLAAFGGLILLAVLLAVLTYQFVEKPFRNRRRFSRSAVFLGAGVFTTGLIAVGGILYFGNGFPARLSPAERAESAVIAAEIKARGAAIQTGVCHYSDDVVRDFGGFLKQWACTPSNEVDGRIFVVGDSHAADIAMALRSGDREIGQVTGAGCSARWSDMSKRCQNLFETLLDRSKLQPGDTIVLANRWGRTADFSGFAKDLAQWKRYGARVILIGPRSEIPNFFRKALSAAKRGGRQTLSEVAPDPGLSDRQMAVFQRQAAAAGVPLIRIDDLFCDLNRSTPCAPVDGDRLLVLDDTHFTVAAAARLGPPLRTRIEAANGRASAVTSR